MPSALLGASFFNRQLGLCSGLLLVTAFSMVFFLASYLYVLPSALDSMPVNYAVTDDCGLYREPSAENHVLRFLKRGEPVKRTGRVSAGGWVFVFACDDWGWAKVSLLSAGE